MTTKLLKLIESYSNGRSLVQQDVDQRAVDAETPPVVGDKRQLAKFVYEKADARARRADHLGEALLADIGDHRFGLLMLPETGWQQSQRIASARRFPAKYRALPQQK
jgi:hypothetical protein